MSFQCQSCGHKGRQAKQGACPACSSFNLKRIRATGQDQDEAGKKKSSKLKSLALTALWIGFIYQLYQHLFVQ